MSYLPSTSNSTAKGDLDKNSIFIAYLIDLRKMAGLKNFTSIQDLFRCIRSSAKLFDHIILSLVIGEKASEVIFGVKKSRYCLQDKQVIMSCFLEEANRLNICLKENGTLTPFIDYPLSTFGVCRCGYRPLYVVTWLSQPEWVRLFLKYGANIYQDDICNCRVANAHVLVKIFSTLIENKFYKDFQAMSECFRLLLNELSPGQRLWSELLRWASRMNYFPDYTSKNERCVPSLKHYSRFAVRNILRRKKKLPSGINELNLPESVKQYLNV